MRLVMDHSALIPCGDKPDYEKEAIRLLGNALPRLNAILYASYRYLKTLASVCAREWRRHHPLPKLQASLDRILRELLELASAKRWQCRDNILSVRSGVKLRIHVVARNALAHVRPSVSSLLSRAVGIGDEDREVLAIAALAQGYGEEVWLVSTDVKLLETAEELREKIELRVNPVEPSEFVAIVGLWRASLGHEDA